MKNWVNKIDKFISEKWPDAFLLILLIGAIIATCTPSQIGYINCSPFPSRCLIVANGDFADTEKWLVRDTIWKDSIYSIEGEFIGDYSFTTYIYPPGGWPEYIIVFDNTPSNDIEGYLTVSHEVLHLMQFLYSDYSVEFTKEVEFSSYLFEYLVNETFKIVNQ
jgi:hypothetical protein